MRVRKLDANGDYIFGRPGLAGFWVDVPDGVAQKIRSRLLLWEGEWFLDSEFGTPWMQQILGAHAGGPPRPPEQNAGLIYDIALKAVIAGTTGVSEILAYASVFDGAARSLTVSATVQTIYSADPVNVNVPISFVIGSGLG